MTTKEHIQNILEAGHSTELRNKLIDYVGSNKKRMEVLMEFFFHEKWRYGQRASWSLGVIGIKQPHLIQPYLPMMVDMLDLDTHDAVKRNIVRIFEGIEIPETVEGPLYDKCMSFVCDPKWAIAIRCFSLTVCAKVATKYPELQSELVEVAKEFMPHGSAGFKFRCRKVIAQFT